MTIEEQIDAIQHVRTECKDAIRELECAVGVVPALPASLKRRSSRVAQGICRCVRCQR